MQEYSLQIKGVGLITATAPSPKAAVRQNAPAGSLVWASFGQSSNTYQVDSLGRVRLPVEYNAFSYLSYRFQEP